MSEDGKDLEEEGTAKIIPKWKASHITEILLEPELEEEDEEEAPVAEPAAEEEETKPEESEQQPPQQAEEDEGVWAWWQLCAMDLKKPLQA